MFMRAYAGVHPPTLGRSFRAAGEEYHRTLVPSQKAHANKALNLALPGIDARVWPPAASLPPASSHDNPFTPKPISSSPQYGCAITNFSPTTQLKVTLKTKDNTAGQGAYSAEIFQLLHSGASKPTVSNNLEAEWDVW